MDEDEQEIYYEIRMRMYHYNTGNGNNGGFDHVIRCESLGEANLKRIELVKAYNFRQQNPNYHRSEEQEDYWDRRWSGDAKPTEKPERIYKITEEFIGPRR